MAESRLSIMIDSQSAEQRADALRRKMDALSQAGVNVNRSMDQASSGIEEQRREMESLLGRIDPVVGKLNQLDKMEEQLRKHRKAGLLPQDDYDEYVKKINRTRDAVGGFDEDLAHAGHTAGQTRQAMRQLPMQFTDIWVSLAAGQNPMTVFIQQGSQIKDSFGGVGPALRETAKYALGIVNPFTLGAAAIAAFTIELYRGNERSADFRKALALTNNAMGVSADQVEALADRIGDITGNSSGARDAVLQLTKEGTSSFAELSQVAESVALRNRATGESVEDLVGQYRELSKDPVNALMELDEQYHFLDESAIRHIQKLVDQGREQDAVKESMRQWADASDAASQKVIDNLSAVDKMLNGLKSGFSSLWDASGIPDFADSLNQAAGDIGFGNNAERIRSLQDQQGGWLYKYDDRRRASVDAELTLRTAIQATSELQLALDKDAQEQESQRVKAWQEMNDLAGDFQSKQDRINKLTQERDQLLGAYNLYGDQKYLEAYEEAQRRLNEAMKDPEAERAAKEAAREAAKAQREAEKAAREHAKAIEEVQKRYQALEDELYPVQASQRSYISDVLLLQSAWDGSADSAGRLIEMMGRLNDAQLSTQTASQTYSGGFGSEIGIRGGIGAPTDPTAQSTDQFDQWLESARNAFSDFDNLNKQAAESFTQGFGDAIEGMVFDFENLGDAARSVFENIGRTVVNTLAQMGAQWVAYQAIQLATGQSTQAAATAGAAATGSAMAAAYAPAAALASLASFGSNSIPASAALTSTTALATSLAASSGFAGLFDRGGDIRSGQWGIVGERGPEIVQGPANVTSRVDTARLMSSARSGASSQQSGNGNPVNVSINNYTDSRVSTRSDGQGGLTIDIVKAELARDFRTNGQVSQAGQQNFQWQRKGR